MTEEHPDQQALPPSSWYFSVNRVLGWCWGVVLPIAVGVALHWPQWVLVAAVLVWYLLNVRVMDKYIPALANPLVERVYRLFYRY
ncbi:MAG: hypothetical protein V4614_08505 [Pseudomonadota bacterium]